MNQAPLRHIGLERYSPSLADAVAERTARHLRGGKQLEPVDRWRKALANDKAILKLIGELPDACRVALALWKVRPGQTMRWDRGAKLLEAFGADYPKAVLLALLQEGLLLLRKPGSTEPISRLDISDLAAPDTLPWLDLPDEFPDAAIPPLPMTPSVASREAPDVWRAADGWDFPIRLAVLWKIATRSPIKRTLQNQLFKRDYDRIAGDPVLSAPPIDAPTRVVDPGLLANSLAERAGYHERFGDEWRPTAPLGELWSANLVDLQYDLAVALLEVDDWNELGIDAPVGSFAQDAASARWFLLLMLGRLPTDACAAVEDLHEVLAKQHAPWHGRGELLGPLRLADARRRLAEEWTKAALLGPLFQVGAVEYAKVTDGQTLVRLTDLGRRLVLQESAVREPAAFAQTLFVQPNHQIIVYRQGLTTAMLSKLALFADLKTSGPALTFEISTGSVYFGLEAGVEAQEMVSLLSENGGREPPAGVIESIRTWSQKRERMTVYGDVALFEFESRVDLDIAVARGVEGIAITDRLLLVPGPPTFPNLRIAAQRDYLQLPPEACVITESDGVTLNIDGSRSDLLLESEVGRFADLLDETPTDFRRRYRITASSIARARDRGIGADWLEEWFARRTGLGPPASVSLLLRLGAGAPVSLQTMLVVELADETAAEGMCQHPTTAVFLVARLGPKALAIDVACKEAFTEALKELGADPNAVREGPP